eukprot:gb/GECG01001435.1/.p1 GENE.gb/GECG01001435.1/~~gb/GECG01001435.1/.p1  ORF type:complete len:486 (+),score=114.44 gb/GECG01001435.1/:1-1458(+)
MSTDGSDGPPTAGSAPLVPAPDSKRGGMPTSTPAASSSGVFMPRRPGEAEHSNSVSTKETAKQARDRRGVFITGGAWSANEAIDPKGYDIEFKERYRYGKAVCKPSNFAVAITKHKRWLRNLQKQRKQLQEEQRRIEEEKAERRRRFMRASMEFYDIVTGKKESNENNGSVSEHKVDDSEIKEQDKRHGRVMSELNRNSPTKILKEKGTRRQGKRKTSEKPPAWAWTEEKKEAEEDKEAEELVNFAENLDFENDMADLEDEATSQSVRKRLEEIDRDVREYESREKQLERKVNEDYEYEYDTVYLNEDELQNAEFPADGTEWEWLEETQNDDNKQESRGWVDAGCDEQGKRIYKRMRRRLRPKQPSISADGQPYPVNIEEHKNDDDIESVAKSAMSHGSVRSVHSKQSLNALVVREKEERKRNQQEQLQQQSSSSAAMGEEQPKYHEEESPSVPRLSIVNESKEARENKKNYVSNLPYQHRNPAI